MIDIQSGSKNNDLLSPVIIFRSYLNRNDT